MQAPEQPRLALYKSAQVAGVDEVGRGPLAGPVVAAAVVLNPQVTIDGLMDSKLLSAKRRQRLAGLVRRDALCWSVAWADPAEIDSLNVLEATLMAMSRAVLGLSIEPGHVQVDGNRCPPLHRAGLNATVETIVRGDRQIAAISAASILAKVHRDTLMCQWDRLYPGYGFARHKGYATRAHRDALQRIGPCPIHRRSFNPLRDAGQAA